MITAAQLRRIFRDCENPTRWAPVIAAAWTEFNLTLRSQQANFLGVVGNETGGLTGVRREDMRYSPELAMRYFPKARANPQKTYALCSRIPQDKGRALASWIYGDRYGNGPESSEDGWNYRGGGLIQLTFLPTYRDCGQALGVDLVGNPDLIVEPATSARAAAWFVTRYKPQIAQLWRDPGESAFLAGADHVGWTDDAHTAIRLRFRQRAIDAFDGVEPPLRVGDHGSAVTALQMALAAAGARIAIDGDFGPATKAAVEQFQAAHGLGTDGIAGNATRAALGLS